MSIHKIYIFSDTIHSGKTTLLQKWLRDKPADAAGILAPDVAGKRKLYDIATDTYHEYETEGRQPAGQTLIMGNIQLSMAAYEKAQAILKEAVRKNPAWLVVDEVGKLEIDNAGLEPYLSEIVAFYKTPQPTGHLILVMRDHLLGAVVDKYGLNTDMILHRSFFEYH